MTKTISKFACKGKVAPYLVFSLGAGALTGLAARALGQSTDSKAKTQGGVFLLTLLGTYMFRRTSCRIR